MATTDDYVLAMRYLENLLAHSKMVHSFAIERDASKHIVITVVLKEYDWTSNTTLEEFVETVFAKSSNLADMAVKVQNFPGACVKLRFRNDCMINKYPDYFVSTKDLSSNGAGPILC